MPLKKNQKKAPGCFLSNISNDLPHGHLHRTPCWGSANYCWIVGKWSFRSSCELSWCVWAERDCVHACTLCSHTAPHPHPVRTHNRSRDRKIHQSLSHAEGGGLKEGVSFLSLTVALLLSLSSVSFSVRPQRTHTSLFLFLSPPGHPCVAWPSLCRLLAFNGLAGGRGSGCYQARPDGRVYPGIGELFWGKTHWPYWWLRQQTGALWEAVSPQLRLPPWSQMLISCL